MKFKEYAPVVAALIAGPLLVFGSHKLTDKLNTKHLEEQPQEFIDEPPAEESSTRIEFDDIIQNPTPGYSENICNSQRIYSPFSNSIKCTSGSITLGNLNEEDNIVIDPNCSGGRFPSLEVLGADIEHRQDHLYEFSGQVEKVEIGEMYGEEPVSRLFRPDSDFMLKVLAVRGDKAKITLSCQKIEG
jgi:hypothetical protein